MWTNIRKSHPQEVERAVAQSMGSAAGLQYCLCVNESPVRTADSPLHKAKSVYKLLASSGLMSPWDVALGTVHGALPTGSTLHSTAGKDSETRDMSWQKPESHVSVVSTRRQIPRKA